MCALALADAYATAARDGAGTNATNVCEIGPRDSYPHALL